MNDVPKLPKKIIALMYKTGDVHGWIERNFCIDLPFSDTDAVLGGYLRPKRTKSASLRQKRSKRVRRAQ